jgi:hypothetical protein
VFKVDYKLSVAGWSVDSATDTRTELLELDVLHLMNSPAGHCRISAYAKAGTDGAGALEQLAGAATSAVGLVGGAGAGGAAGGPSASVRGQQVKSGDAMSVEVTAGSTTATVATAKVRSAESSLELVTLVGRTGMQQLAETRLNQVYENQSLGQIVGDLAQQAGVTTGDVDQGSRYSYLAVHESRSVLRAVVDLARREGMDVWFDADDRLCVKKFSKTRADHVFRYGVEILELAVTSSDPVSGRVLVHGESPSSSSGSDTWHWLVSDLAPYRGDNGSGKRVLAVQDGAVRTKAAADAAAEARLTAIRQRATTARLAVLGRPTVRLGDGIEVQDVPAGALTGVAKVAWVRHLFSVHEGYVTVVGAMPT